MSADPFEIDLSRMFLQPSGEADPARLTVRVLERLEREERQRRVIILGAAVTGAAITAVAMAASGAGRIAQILADQVSSIAPLSVGSAPWIGAVTLMVGLTLAGLYTSRAVSDL